LIYDFVLIDFPKVMGAYRIMSYGLFNHMANGKVTSFERKGLDLFWSCLHSFLSLANFMIDIDHTLCSHAL